MRNKPPRIESDNPEKNPAFVKRDECPACLHPIECASHLEDESAKARPGDFSICMYCVSILRFDKDMNLYLPSEDEIAAEDVAPQLFRMTRAIRAYRKIHPNK